MTNKLKDLATAFVASMDGSDGPRQGYEISDAPEVAGQNSVTPSP